MSPPPFDPIVFIGMIGLAVIVPLVSVGRFVARPKRALSYVVLTLLMTAWLALSTDVLVNLILLPPAIFILTALGIVAVVFITRNVPQKRLRSDISIFSIIAIQSFRLPLELLMWHAAARGIMPVAFSLKGYNLDVITGLGALGLAFALAATSPRKQPKLVSWIRVWNLWGVACLSVIAALAVLTSPRLHFFGASADKINTWVLYFPYVWLPTVLVPCAVLGHILTTRWLRQNPRSP